MRTSLSTALSAVLLVLLAVLVPLSALAAWVDLEIDDTERYTAAVSPLASDPAVRDTVADLITGEAMKHIGLGPLQDSAEQFLHRAVLSFTTTDTFRAAWDSANRTAHTAMTRALDGEDGEAVTIDLAPVIEQVKQRLEDDGTPFADQIPVTRTELTVVSGDAADRLRSSFWWLRSASVWPAVGTVVLLVVVVGSATVRGGRTAGLFAAAVTGAGLVLGALVLRALLAVAGSRVLDAVPDGDRAGAAAVSDALTASLRTTAWWVLAVGAVLLVAGAVGRRLLRRSGRGAGLAA